MNNEVVEVIYPKNYKKKKKSKLPLIIILLLIIGLGIGGIYVMSNKPVEKKEEPKKEEKKEEPKKEEKKEETDADKALKYLKTFAFDNLVNGSIKIGNTEYCGVYSYLFKSTEVTPANIDNRILERIIINYYLNNVDATYDTIDLGVDMYKKLAKDLFDLDNINIAVNTNSTYQYYFDTTSNSYKIQHYMPGNACKEETYKMEFVSMEKDEDKVVIKYKVVTRESYKTAEEWNSAKASDGKTYVITFKLKEDSKYSFVNSVIEEEKVEEETKPEENKEDKDK